jgi:xanthine dehydrogenase accessory factor
MNRLNREFKVVVRGAGEMASGVIHRLYNNGFNVIALEIPEPSCVRRLVCFAEAVYEDEITIGSVKGQSVRNINEAEELLGKNIVPILVDPEAHILNYMKCKILIDGRMLKSGMDISREMAELVIGLGPGFVPGINCHMAIETNRGNNLGRVLTDSSPEEDTGIPAPIDGVTTERVFRAPASGMMTGKYEIGDFVNKDDIIAEIGNTPVKSEISGVLRGICRSGLRVVKDQKIGDIDPRGRRELCYRISEKAVMIANGVMQAIENYEKLKVNV